MGTPPNLDLNLQALIERFGSLTIQISLPDAARDQTSRTQGASAATGATTASSSGPSATSSSSPGLAPPADQLDLQPAPATPSDRVLSLARHLRAPLGGHSPEGRIRLAYQLGREAARIFTGERRCFESASISSRRTVYVILAGDLVERPFFTHSADIYFKTVKPHGEFDPASISHGFASISEAEISVMTEPTELEYLQGWRTAADGDYTKLFLTYGDRTSHCLLVRAVRSGFILCAPRSAIPQAALDEATASEFGGVLGPWTAATLPVATAAGKPIKKTAACLLVDINAAGVSMLSEQAPMTNVWPVGKSALEALEVFINGDELEDLPERLEPYFTCSSGAEALADGAVGAEPPDAVQHELLQQILAQTSTQGGPAFNARGAGRPTFSGLFEEGADAKLRSSGSVASVGRASTQDFRRPSRPFFGSFGSRPGTVLGAGAGLEDDEEDDEDLGAATAGGTDLLSRLLAQQTQILSQRRLRSVFESDGGERHGGSAAPPGAVRERLAQARRRASVAELEPRDMWAHFQETVPLGNFKTLTYLSFLMAEMWEAAERGHQEELLSLLSLGLVFCEQAANEQGHTRLAWLLTCREDPPFAVVEQRKAPRAEVPHGMLADPRWIATQLGYLRDVETIQDRTQRSHHQQLGLVGRRKARWDFRNSCRSWVRLLVAAGNWLVQGLERHAAVWIRLAQGPKCGLERAFQKFDQIDKQLQVLHQMSAQLYSDLQPYSKPPRGQEAEKDTVDSEPSAASPMKVSLKASAPTCSLKIDPKRLKFEHAPRFKAEPFLVDPLLRAGFSDPSVFQRPASDWDRPKWARVQASQADQLELYRKWDAVESLYLLRASESEVKFRCGFFAVYKNDKFDRQILNPIPENGRSFSVSDATLSLAHASLLCQLYLPAGKSLVINSDDLEDFYHGFQVDDRHAARNHIHGVFYGRDFQGWQAYREELHDVQVVGCFKTLAMGTNFAVETAQHAHSVLLRRAGGLHPSEQVAYRQALPKGPGFDLLCIDDRVFLLVVCASELNRPPQLDRRDIRLFSQAAAQYEKTHLRVSQKKAVRNSYQAVVLGGELDGVRGDLAAPRLKTAALCCLTFQLIVLGVCSKSLLQCILGCWVFVTMFRRPAMSLLGQVYHDFRGREDDEVFRLSMEAKQELLQLIVWAPLMFSNLRAEPVEALFCTDASPFAAGVCEARMPREAVLELLRHADYKGHHTMLQPAISSYLEMHQEFIASVPHKLPGSLAEGILFDVCEIFQGANALSLAALTIQAPRIRALQTAGDMLRRPAHQPARWIGDLGTCLGWKKLLQYRFRKQNHININEELCLRSLFRHLSSVHPVSRFGVLLDSRVTIGCNAKGRSSSMKLNYYLSTSLPFILGGELFPALFHIGTGDNVSDDPSRLRELRTAPAEQPVWLRLFLAGRHKYFDLVRAADDRLTPVVASRRHELYRKFCRWIEEELHCEFAQVCASGLLLSTALVGYGKSLFYSGQPKYVFSESINAVSDQFKHLRAHFAAAWGILSRWEEEEPGERSMVMPESLLRAAVTLSLLWRWPHFTGFLLLGFHALLRPSEILKLRRRDLILPRDLLTDVPVAFVRILGSKTKRFLQRQHARISDALSVAFLDALFGHCHPLSPLFDCSPAVLRRRWNALFSALGVPVTEDLKGITPKSLRGSGATWLYQRTEEVDKIMWRGRWQQRRTLEHYLQDVAGQLLLVDLAESHRLQIQQLSGLSVRFLVDFVNTFHFAHSSR
ncbi:SUF4 [Symbiodinium sp. CCMP2592]|nr:SUF4 [Symbiodinium sp. CCMP2592]